MDRARLIEIIDQAEQSIDVNQLKVDDMILWPALKIKLFAIQ